MKNEKRVNSEKYYSLSATLLSFVASVIGFSNLELKTWWQFILAFVIICAIYVLFYYLICLVGHIYVHKFKPPSLTVDVQEELDVLCRLSSELYEKQMEYATVNIPEYKDVLDYELKMLYEKLDCKICFIEDNIKNSEINLENKIPILSEDLKRYKDFCESIKTTFKL